MTWFLKSEICSQSNEGNNSTFLYGYYHDRKQSHIRKYMSDNKICIKSLVEQKSERVWECPSYFQDTILMS